MRQLRIYIICALCGWSGCSKPTPVEEIRATATLRGSDAELVAAAADWPWWRGPSQTNVVPAMDIPVRWDDATNVRWSVELPGRGHSCPTVCGDRVYLTSADEDREEQWLYAFDRASGERLQAVKVHEGGFERIHAKNTHATATPACDGQQVYCAFVNHGGLHVSATDRDGNIIWTREAGPFVSEWGYGASPVLHGPLVIINGDNRGGSYIAALDRRTGEIVWRTARDGSGRHGSYATPVVAEVAGRKQLIITGFNRVTSYDPDTGQELWYCRGISEVTAGSIATDDELVFASGGYPEKEILAIRADGQGDVSQTHVVWRQKQGVTYVPSLVSREGRVYVVNDKGIFSCFGAKSGELLWRERLNGQFSSSPVFVGELLFVMNEVGAVFVCKTDPELQIVAENRLSDTGFATPIAAGDALFLRSGSRLFRIESDAHGATHP